MSAMKRMRYCRASGLCALIDVGKEPLHIAIRVRRSSKTYLAVQAVSIPGKQDPPAQALQFRVSYNYIHQPFAQSLPAKWLQYKHIAKVGKRSVIRDDASKTKLLLTLIYTKGKRVLYRSLHDIDGNTCRPI